MRKFLINGGLIFCLFHFTLLAAQQKGVHEIIQPEAQDAKQSHNTYAVVVGISDYQDPGIPDLRFADKDAVAFANYLRSEAGGKLDGDHLKLLINQQATMAQMANVLDWLMENCKEGDQAIIYFSGHGDVEKRTLTQPGFLLCWDAPSRVYMAGGAFALPMLQEVISTLSIQNKAKVIVITDACRSGNLAGSSIGGSQATAANLAKQYANEIKILSCQPNEYSIEGEQWGGGRGAFSYNLVNGLYGLADGNKDMQVSLKEVDRYLEDHVAAEVAPVNQNPQVIGNPTEVLSNVNERLLASVRERKSGMMPVLSAVDSRGIEEDVLVSVDSSIRLTYRLFKQALKEKRFLPVPTKAGEPVERCADWYYNKLIQEPGLGKLHSTMRRNYAAALQDDAQQVLNTMLRTGLTEEVRSAGKPSKLYTLYPEYLHRAAELLGKDHFMYRTLQARRYFFEGKIANSTESGKQAYFKALEWQPEMPHALAELINLMTSSQTDSALFYFKRATAQAPLWVVPYMYLADFYAIKRRQPEKAEDLFTQAGLVDSNSVLVWYWKADFYYNQLKYEEAKPWYLKTISSSGSDVCFPCAYNGLGEVYRYSGQYKESEYYYKKAIQLDTTFLYAYAGLASLYNETNRITEAENLLTKVLGYDSTFAIAHNVLGVSYTFSKRYPEAEAAFKKAMQYNPGDLWIYTNLAGIYCDFLGRYAESEALFKKVLQFDSSFAVAYDGLGQVYGRMGRYEEAIRAFIKVIQLTPNYSNAYTSLGSVYLFTKSYQEAEPFFNKAIELDSNAANPRRHLGLVCFKTNRPDEARQQFRKSLELDPNYAPAMLGMAYVLTSEGKMTEAIGFVEQSIGRGSSYEELKQDEDLAPLFTLPEWKMLIKKYFPDKVKD